MDTPHRFSTGGFITATLTVILGILAYLNLSPSPYQGESVICIVGAFGVTAIAFLMRSFIGPIHVGRGGIAWVGGMLLGFLWGCGLWESKNGGSGMLLFFLLGLALGGPLLRIGLRKPSSSPQED
ncbi:MAG: hypothetical protein HY774_11070 [Acidobacteria bacterium]|nr:hypothetical protein [Acidobacteriota bacterium]